MRAGAKAYFRLQDYLLIAMTASMGIAAKVIIVPLAQAVSGLLFIPGGAVAGGFYMMFLVLAAALTGKKGAALLAALVQAALVLVSGSIGSHGAASIITYTLPGLAAEAVFFAMGHRGCCALCCFFACIAANLAGTLAVNWAIFDLSALPLALTLCAAALSGAAGGLAANAVVKGVEKLGVVKRSEKGGG